MKKENISRRGKIGIIITGIVLALVIVCAVTEPPLLIQRGAVLLLIIAAIFLLWSLGVFGKHSIERNNDHGDCPRIQLAGSSDSQTLFAKICGTLPQNGFAELPIVSTDELELHAFYQNGREFSVYCVIHGDLTKKNALEDTMTDINEALTRQFGENGATRLVLAFILLPNSTDIYYEKEMKSIYSNTVLGDSYQIVLACCVQGTTAVFSPAQDVGHFIRKRHVTQICNLLNTIYRDNQ